MLSAHPSFLLRSHPLESYGQIGLGTALALALSRESLSTSPSTFSTSTPNASMRNAMASVASKFEALRRWRPVLCWVG